MSGPTGRSRTPASRSTPTRGSTRSTSATASRRSRASPTPSSLRSTATGRGSSAATCSRRPARSRCRAGRTPASSRALDALGLEQEVSDPAPGGEAAARKRLDAFLDSDVVRLLRQPRRPRPGPDLAPVSIPALRVHLAAPDRGAAAGEAREGPRRLPPPALLARLLPPRPLQLPAERALRVPGPLPRQDQVELRREGRSRRGARGGPASRSSTPGCASSWPRAGCTTAPGLSSARS